MQIVCLGAHSCGPRVRTEIPSEAMLNESVDGAFETAATCYVVGEAGGKSKRLHLLGLLRDGRRVVLYSCKAQDTGRTAHKSGSRVH